MPLVKKGSPHILILKFMECIPFFVPSPFVVVPTASVNPPLLKTKHLKRSSCFMTLEVNKKWRYA
jgi:hypothetical protein